MYEKSNRGKIIKLMFLLVLLGVSNLAYGADVSSGESEPFFQMSTGTVSIPVKIAPVSVNAPARHVDLLPEPSK